MGRASQHPPELRERAVRMVAEVTPDHPQWAAINAVAQKLGIGTAETPVLDEGLQLGWVPAAPILEKLFSVSSASERRGILGPVLREQRREWIFVEHQERLANQRYAEPAADAACPGRCQLGGAVDQSRALPPAASWTPRGPP